MSIADMEEDTAGAMLSNERGLKHSEVVTALGSLSLTWVSVGDYLVIMSGQVDAEICSEPYLALQLWLNIKSGKFIARIWNQTTARGRAASIAHFVEACETLFQGRPCIGCPADTQGLNSIHLKMYQKLSRKQSHK